MRKFNILLVLLVTMILWSSCDDDDETAECPPPVELSSLKLTFIPTWNGITMQEGSEYTDQFDTRLLQFNFKTFISSLKLTTSNEEIELSDVELLSFDDGEVELNYAVPNNSTFTSFKFHTGVDPEFNVDYDPSTWPNNHPLSVQGAQGMHWGWNTGYIFTKFDGKADTTDAVEPTYLYPFAFHVGADEFYTEHIFESEMTSQNQSDLELTIRIRMEKFFSSVTEIDIRDDGETHTGGDFELAQQFVDNFNTSFELE